PVVSYCLPLCSLSLFCDPPHHPAAIHSSPTRRSSDLAQRQKKQRQPQQLIEFTRREIHLYAHPDHHHNTVCQDQRIRCSHNPRKDRKSTRLNSSHVSISYAVFCLKKKRKKDTNIN